MNRLNTSEDASTDGGDDYTLDYATEVDEGIEISEEFDDDEDETDRETIKMKSEAPKNSLRLFMVIVLVVVTFFGVLGIYGFGRSIENDEFTIGFESIAHRVNDVCNANAQRKLETLKAIAELVSTSVIDDPAMEWPLVSLHRPSRDLELHRKYAGFDAVFLMPIVSQVDRMSWERYSYEYSGWLNGDDFQPNEPGVSLFIKDKVGRDDGVGPYVPQWQYSPMIPNRGALNFNWRTLDGFREDFQTLQEGNSSVSHVWTFDPVLNSPSMADSIPFKFLRDLLESKPDYVTGEPVSFVSTPIFENPNDAQSRVVGVATAMMRWSALFEDIFQESTRGVISVVKNSFNQVFTLQIDGGKVSFLGFGDQHNSKYDLMVQREYIFFDDEGTTVRDESNQGTYTIDIYPSATLEPLFLTAKPAIYGAILFTVFAFTSLVFLAYDSFVESRQKYVMHSADQARAVVNSLFPEMVGNRLIEEQGLQQGPGQGNTMGLFGGMNINNRVDQNPTGVPIADFFPDTTILFADIKGFTAWSSSREPAKVFMLLESIFGAFDKIAKKRRVFKVETVGDCYVAVAGLPQPRKDHAVAMARFSYDCLRTMKSLVHDLEDKLGPGTSHLDIRVGLHSGPVTAGVLRGEKTRFQLFGDAMNTASRMESTGVAGKIQVSETTAHLIINAGKVNWVEARSETVHAKGKGEMNTFWLDLSNRGLNDQTTSVGSSAGSDAPMQEFSSEIDTSRLSSSNRRLVRWNVEVLRRALQKIVAKRDVLKTPTQNVSRSIELKFCTEHEDLHKAIEVMEFAPYEPESVVSMTRVSEVELGQDVERQLEEYVETIAQQYLDNHFHSFEHCSHVMLSVDKLLTRIVRSNQDEISDTKAIHESSYGIASDPLAQWSMSLAALVHDVDHQGISNDQLMKERPSLAREYGHSSVAEKVSLDLAWSLLMEDRFSALRKTIYCNEYEFLRFRQLMVNAVLATDVLDPTLKKLRDVRWENAFNQSDETTPEDLNRKATVIVQHLMEASDVAHCMQHWHVYRKWNTQLFREISKAYRDGRCGKDPVTFWYEGELSFFDHWVIPLAKKLQQCRAFGVSSDEYLNYAIQNRTEWERRGKEEVALMVQQFGNEL